MLETIGAGGMFQRAHLAEELTTADGSTAKDRIHRRSHSSSKTCWLKAMGMDET